VSPDGKQAMIEHAEQFANLSIPFVFDPGQGLPMFDVEELKAFIDQAAYITVNDYESQLLQERMGMSLQQIASQVGALIVTKGAKGSEIFTDSAKIEIPIGRVTGAVDPTGCGDAFRAGLLYGITNGNNWEDVGKLASLMGAINVEHHGTQNHHFTIDEFAERFRESFGYSAF
jgi:adenosine kinase